MELSQLFDNFKLDTLDEQWIDEVWDKEFLSIPEPPVDYLNLLDSEEMVNFLTETCVGLKKWIAQVKKKEESLNIDLDKSELSWKTINEMVKVRKLLAVLSYLIKTGQTAGAEDNDRQACLLSTGLYFLLLSVPGSSTFRVFHSNLYNRAVETLKLSQLLATCNNKKKISESETTELGSNERKILIQSLNVILIDLIDMLKTFYMKFQLRSLEVTVINLVEMTKLETEVNPFVTNESNYKKKNSSITNLVFNAYVALKDLVEPRHGVNEVTIKVIMKYLMPHLCPQHLDFPNKAANVVWDTIINFFKDLLDTKGTSADKAMEILIQHLLINCPDRSEPRQKMASSVAKLINICQGKLFLDCIKNLVFFSFHQKISFRIFGQEVVSKLLNEMTSLSVDDGTSSSNRSSERKRARTVLIATVHSRSMDVSSMVRGKSLSTIESLVTSRNFVMDDFLNNLEKDNPFLIPELVEQALFEYTNPLPGSNTFINMLLERIKDERALVRRSTMHTLQNLMSHFPLLFDKVVPIIGHHCRDPALSVRKEAISTLADLLQSHPLNKALLIEYIRSALPRIFDVETKVQEKVLESLQNLVLNKISEATTDDEAQKLPWNILNVLTSLRMRKNLSKICNIWVKNKVVTETMISNLQSNVNTKNDVEAWVLLLALAENMELNNMKRFFENFKELFETDDFACILKLQVLRYIVKTMDVDYLKELFKNCFDYLSKFQVPMESIGTCVDILYIIGNHLKSNDNNHNEDDTDSMLSQMINLMRKSEVQIDKLDDDEEIEEIDDDNIYTYLKAMNTLGHTSLVCSEDVTQSTLSIVQALLIDCEDSKKMSEKHLIMFKAVGIVLLCQQALRDRDFAEEVIPIFGHLMRSTSNSESIEQSAIRINAVKALADLCVRFTAMVEPYLPDMCVIMKDSNPIVRETILVIFVQLLLEDYIKVKGAFFYHIMTMLADKEKNIRELTIFLIKERLLTKNKSLISQAFVKSLFHYNNCQLSHKFSERKIRNNEREVLSLPGKKNEKNRRIIYDFMMEQIEVHNKLKILTKLNAVVFEAVCEKMINVEEIEGIGVLKDVIYILTNERMQASYGTKIPDDDCVQEDVAVAIETQTNNAVNVIVEGMKDFKHKVMIQTLIKLKELLLEKKLPILYDVSKFLGKLLSDLTKEQLEKLLDEYPNLKKDIDRDISTHEDTTDENNDSDLDDELRADIVVHDVEENQSLEMESIIKPIDEIVSSPTPSQLLKKGIPKKISDIHLKEMPYLVLRRLSALTYPGVETWISPPRDDTNRIYQKSPSSSSEIFVAKNIINESSNSDALDTVLSPIQIKKARLTDTISEVQIT